MLSRSIIYLFRILFVADTFFIQSNTSPPTITIDVDKGVILQQLGYYSEKLEQQVVHIFIPFNNLCIDTPNSDVCHYSRSTNIDIKEVGTIQSYAAQMSSIYDRKAIANIIEKDIRRVFHKHDIREFLDVTQSMIYFIDDRFYLASNSNNILVPSAHSLSDRGERSIEYRTTHFVSLVQQQIISQKIGYSFLSNDQLAELLALIMSNTSQLFDTVNTRQNMNRFIDMIIGQTLFVMKSCSINDKENTRVASSCLVISTLVRKLPLESSSVYIVYRAIPLPVSFEEHQYVYENLPQIFGYNVMNKNVVIWNEEEVTSSCLLSQIIQCRFNPITVELSSLPCLAEILSTESSSGNQCQVRKSKNFQTGVLNIEDNLWYFYSSAEPFLCQFNSPTSTTMDTILIRPPMLVTFPCNEEIQCSDIKLPATECINRSLYVKTKKNLMLDEKSLVSLSLMNITDRLISIHKTAVRRSVRLLQTEVNNSKTMIDKFLEDFISSLISALSLFLLSIALIVARYIKNKMNTKIEKLQTEINRLNRDLIDDV